MMEEDLQEELDNVHENEIRFELITTEGINVYHPNSETYLYGNIIHKIPWIEEQESKIFSH